MKADQYITRTKEQCLFISARNQARIRYYKILENENRWFSAETLNFYYPDDRKKLKKFLGLISYYLETTRIFWDEWTNTWVTEEKILS